MTVFKNYLKISKKYIPMIIMYTVIFTFFAVAATSANSSGSGASFAITKPNVAIINKDKDTVLINSFTKYIKGNADIVKIDDNEQALKDALFFREADYILIVPKNFTSDFMAGLKPKIETMKIPDSSSATYLSMLLNRYLNIANIYVKSGMNEKQISTAIAVDLNKTTKVDLLGKESTSKLESASYFFNFANYTLLAVCVSVVAMIMNAFNKSTIKRRNIVSGVPYAKVGRQLFLGNLVIMTLIWLAYVVISLMLYGSAMLEPAGLLMILNSFVFSITVLAIGFLVGMLVKSKEAINGIINVIALGSSFICGAFVPQQFLGDFVLSISRILPSYWYIKNNNIIAGISLVNNDTLQPIFVNMLIVFGFGILFFCITNVVNRYKVRDN